MKEFYEVTLVVGFDEVGEPNKRKYRFKDKKKAQGFVEDFFNDLGEEPELSYRSPGRFVKLTPVGSEFHVNVATIEKRYFSDEAVEKTPSRSFEEMLEGQFETVTE